MAREKKETPAGRHGRRDADIWMQETPENEWADAIKPGVLGADEALINSLGTAEAAKRLGVSNPYRNGNLTDAASDAFEEYSRAWAKRVSDALHSQKTPTTHHATKKSPAQLQREIDEVLATAKAREISDRRIAALIALGEDVRNTPAWRDAMSERRMINFRSGSKGRAMIKKEPWWKGKFETDPGPEVAKIFLKHERATARRIKEVSSSRQAALAWLERVGSEPSSDSNIRKITAAAEKRLSRSHSTIRSSAVKRGSQSSRRRRRP